MRRATEHPCTSSSPLLHSLDTEALVPVQRQSSSSDLAQGFSTAHRLNDR